jgi:uncharacterized protein YkwD
MGGGYTGAVTTLPTVEGPFMRPRRVVLALAGLSLALLALGWAAAARAGSAPSSIYLPLICGSGCGSQPPVNPEIPDPFEARVIELANEARVAAGCPVATVSPLLTRLSGEWSRYMDATRDYGHSPVNYYPDNGYEGIPLEMIGGDAEPEYIFERWMASPLHRAGIEYCIRPGEPEYRPDLIYEIGAGHDGYWTLVIGVR